MAARRGRAAREDARAARRTNDRSSGPATGVVQQREQIGAVNAIDHHAGAAVDVDAFVDGWHWRAGGVCGCQRERLPLHLRRAGGVVGEAQRLPIAPGEHLRLATATQPRQLRDARLPVHVGRC